MEARDIRSLLAMLTEIVEADSQHKAAPVRIETHGGFAIRRVYIADHDEHWPDGYCILETD